jgi:class 3 adenylate cyclase
VPAEVKEQIQLEVAHVLFIDVVGYSKLSINEQRAVVDELTTIVRGSDQYQKAEAAGRLIKIPTGDGMALVFYTSQESPAQCAIEISGALKEHPRLQVRMGVHSGPVSGVIDVNGHANLAGAGINMAQRVMACGDAGHILVSKHVAEDSEEISLPSEPRNPAAPDHGNSVAGSPSGKLQIGHAESFPVVTILYDIYCLML